MGKEILLTQGKVALVDDEDYEILSKYNWRYVVTSPGRQGYARAHIYGDDWKDRTDVYMHRVVVSAEDGQMIDHINRDKLDNRKSNLRIATSSQNNSNVTKLATNTSGYKGVTFYKRTGRWMAQIMIDKKYKCIGYYSSPEDAALAYNEYVHENGDKYIPTNEIKDVVR